MPAILARRIRLRSANAPRVAVPLYHRGYVAPRPTLFAVLEPSLEHQATPKSLSTIPSAGAAPEGEPPIPDGQLIARAAAGDLAAFNVIVERYQRAVFAVCMNLLRDRMLAEDVTQDTFIRAWGAVASFQGDSAKSWLARIASNRCLDLLRAQQRQPIGSLDAQLVELEPRWSSMVESTSPEISAEHLELGDRLTAALEDVPEDQRTALLLADVLGYDYSEIADLTGAAIGTVKSRISRARARLRQTLLGDTQSREHIDRFVRS